MSELARMSVSPLYSSAVTRLRPRVVQPEPSVGSGALCYGIAQVALGHRASFRDLFELTKTRLYATCLRLLHEPSAAEEALQETYARVWHCAATFRGYSEGEAWAWLFQIARSRCFDQLRARRRAVLVVAGDDVAWEDIADDATTDFSVECPLNDDRLKHCVNKLSEKKQTAIRLAFYDGCTYAEIAKRLSVALPTIKSDVRRSLIELRRCLQQTL
jgi:RNA polymerase sigma-70 factor, ECF subfamily